MGCGGSRPEDMGQSATVPSNGSSSSKPAANKRASQRGNAAVEALFRANGKERTLNDGEKFIEQGSEVQSAFYIKSGKVSLLLETEDGTVQTLDTRTTGDMLGELSLLLGHPASATVVADGAAVVIEVLQEELIKHLREDPSQSGRLFKAMAVALAERISDLSGMLRANVVTSSAMPNQRSQQLPQADVNKARSMFGLSADEKLISFYQCSVRAERNAIKDEHAHVGEVYIFGKHVCFDLKVFAFHKQVVLESKDIVALLKQTETAKDASHTIELQLKGSSYEVTIENGYDECCMLIEASRMQAKSAQLASERLEGDIDIDEPTNMEEFHGELEPIVLGQGGERREKHRAVDFDLKEEDWKQFLECARQRTYKKGEYILREGQPTAALFQIVKGTVRVELQIKDKAQAVIVGYRQAGDMFGETSLLKSGVATASIAADSEAVIICLEGAYLEGLFQTSPGLPGRFFCFIAAYEAERLYSLTQSAAESKAPTITAATSVRVPIDELLSNRAFSGLFRKFLVVEEQRKRKSASGSVADHTANPSVALGTFDMALEEADFRHQPNSAALMKKSLTIHDKYLEKKSPSYLPYLPQAQKDELGSKMAQLEAGTLKNAEARKMFADLAAAAGAFLEAHWYEPFLGSDHYHYILDLKAKEGIVPKLEQFKVIRVLGEGGFGQVIEVVKRDCGVRYAMKVMQKDAMKQALGVTWRKKIAMEANILGSLQHPFMVNLSYAFQNSDFLCLVMDLVPSGDLSEFVLTPRRLTPDQTKWAIMEVVEVISYMHRQKILYRDLKPENLLVDDEGHVRLIDMGLAVRWTGDKPRRTSRVGTDCYMAPEVRWARKNREAYGTSVDWYTVGVLLYEFTNGALPFSQRDTLKPVYRPGDFPNAECQHLCESLLAQDYKQRIGCGMSGVDEIKGHMYFATIDWDIVSACKLPSPLKGVKGVPKRKKDKEQQAQRTAHTMLESDLKEERQEDSVTTWDYVSAAAITDEYLESMYRCVSSI